MPGCGRCAFAGEIGEADGDEERGGARDETVGTDDQVFERGIVGRGRGQARGSVDPGCSQNLDQIAPLRPALRLLLPGQFGRLQAMLVAHADIGAAPPAVQRLVVVGGNAGERQLG